MTILLQTWSFRPNVGSDLRLEANSIQEQLWEPKTLMFIQSIMEIDHAAKNANELFLNKCISFKIMRHVTGVPT